MVTYEFTSGRKPSYYEVTVRVSDAQYSFGVVTKATYEAVVSALLASLKDSYELTVAPTKPWRSEYESLDTACSMLSRIRFVEYTTKDVEKVIIVKETVRKEL